MEYDIFKPSDQASKFQVLMMSHFPGVTVREVMNLKCEMCQDFKQKYCDGKNLKGKEVAKCMWDRADEVEVEITERLFNPFIQ